MNLDTKADTLTVEAGVLLSDILDFIVPKGYFLPVVPGTKFITVGGAIANDVHGKNHHKAGTFGNYVTALTVHTSTQGTIACSLDSNTDMFNATIAGLGLTGVILKATLKLIPIKSAHMHVKQIPFNSLEEYFNLVKMHEDTTYTAAWLDSMPGKTQGRGIYFLAEHADTPPPPTKAAKPPQQQWGVPFCPPIPLLNRFTLRAFNTFYYHFNKKPQPRYVHYNSYFFPLDSINEWNKLYGPQGLMQYQCVIPTKHAKKAVQELLNAASAAKHASFLTVIKHFAGIPSPGLLSFPKEGVTITLDFAFRGDTTLRLFHTFEQIIRVYGGRSYPAKDGTMSAEYFQTSYPNWEKVNKLRDPHINSSFWQRVTKSIN